MYSLFNCKFNSSRKIVINNSKKPWFIKLDLDENALYVHKEIDASSLLRYFGELDVDNKKVFSIRNIDEISKESILKIYEY